MNSDFDSDDMDTFMDPMCEVGTRPCQIELPKETREDLCRLINRMRFEPEKAAIYLLEKYAADPLRTLVQVFLSEYEDTWAHERLAAARAR